ncbi:MAG: type III-A CRISPR-associated RAMP protein Csm3 [Cyanobacteriota bacterium]
MSNNVIRSLIDKIEITGELELITGMHIGASNDFAPIGAVDSVVVRDPLTKQPIIPGSSLKGKMRTLLAKIKANKDNETFVQNFEDDGEVLQRLFGFHGYKNEKKGRNDPPVQSRLQFYDLFLLNVPEIEQRNTDLYLSEIKFENTINRTTAVAMPRQIERVPAGALFKLNLIYNLETDKKEEIFSDFQALKDAFKLIQVDYIGGSGTRGYGKVKLNNFKVVFKQITDKQKNITEKELQDILVKAQNFALCTTTK